MLSGANCGKLLGAGGGGSLPFCKPIKPRRIYEKCHHIFVSQHQLVLVE